MRDSRSIRGPRPVIPADHADPPGPPNLSALPIRRLGGPSGDPAARRIRRSVWRVRAAPSTRGPRRIVPADNADNADHADRSDRPNLTAWSDTLAWRTCRRAA
ncbi:hypothetical protein GCM10023205_42290 [Yinghuangia aomiensis]|uniref:Uncharacterized protein n=1 Tax=Yinghuangia aomiensis TaxID=676205 RepID=A0ABP9HIM6_9ACTN